MGLIIYFKHSASTHYMQ